MPIYEYRCEKCGHRFERWQKMSDPDPKRCPVCRAAKVERLISAVGFRLKGSGWYETDFKKDHRHNIAGDGEITKKKENPGDKQKGKDSGKPVEKKPKAGGEGKKPASKVGESAA